MKIKSDNKGVYVRVDGWIARPRGATRLQAGQTVVASHPPGGVARVRPENTALQEAEIWRIHEPFWWHPIEGKGPRSKELRNADRQRFADVYLPNRPHTAAFVANFPEN